jgi:hypothetical protein
MITHPVPVGTLTNIGTIRSYKFVRYGYGKYRYFVEEVDTDFKEDQITEIIKKSERWIKEN